MSNNALLLVPPKSHQSRNYTNPITSAPSAPGLPDTLRTRQPNLELFSAPSDLPSSSTSLQSTHPLEARLRHWNDTRHALQMQLLKRQYGVAAPLIRGMELLDVEVNEEALYWGGRKTGGSVHGDVLRGCDWEVGGWEGVYSEESLGEWSSW
ncbi:MAG: hypothetical protein Q9162_001949 [Coniocarpon cinnabarinum]